MMNIYRISIDAQGTLHTDGVETDEKILDVSRNNPNAIIYTGNFAIKNEKHLEYHVVLACDTIVDDRTDTTDVEKVMAYGILRDNLIRIP